MTVGSRLSRELIEAPVRSPATVAAVGEAIWLYLRFVSLATTSGHACRARTSLARDLGTAEDQIDRWVAALVEASLISIVSPGPFLVIKLTMWSSSDTLSAVEGPESAASAGSQENN